jgi:hypothetical protein
MTGESRRMDKLRHSLARSLTRKRKAPDWIESEFAYLGSEEHRKLSRDLFQLALFGLAFGVVLYGVGWAVFTVFHLQ